MQKIFVVGDIHGCFDKLCALMDKIPIDFNRDLLIFIGDYIDRGENPTGVVDYALGELRLKYVRLWRRPSLSAL